MPKQTNKKIRKQVTKKKKNVVKLMKKKIRRNAALSSAKALIVSVRSRHNTTVACNKLRRDVRKLLDTDFSAIAVTPDAVIQREKDAAAQEKENKTNATMTAQEAWN